ncbi:MAG: UDP-glucose 4-epimerase GalE [Spirochaetes bacterium]|nr:UDP-glucose 4-epimerase GalE [Spirochaetota bacterium]
MKIFVIGGAGYIGSHVVLEFLDGGHEVTVYDNLSSGARVNLSPQAAFVEGDILDPAALTAAMGRGFDAVVHLAAFKAAGESMVAPEKYSVNNITGTINILNAMCSTGVRRIVFSSSAAVYGEPAYIPIDEDHPTNPENYYGFTKLEIERFLAWYDRLKGIRYAALRYFNAAGYDGEGRVRGLEKNPANLLPVIMEAAAGKRAEVLVFGNDYPTKDGTGVRDYVHVSDLAAAHVSSLAAIDATDASLVLNLGSEEGLSVTEILETARRVTGRPIPSRAVGRRPGDPAKLVASAELARGLLGWNAGRSGVGNLVETSWNAYRREFGL